MSQLMVTVILAFAWMAASPAAASAAFGGDRFRAFAVNLGATGPLKSGPVDIDIQRWSSEADRAMLWETFTTKGPEALLDRLRDMPPVGHIRYGDTVSPQGIRFVMELPGEDGGRRILALADRDIGFREAATRPRTIDYPFTVLELRVDDNGDGSGSLAAGTRLSMNSQTGVLEIEYFSSEPIRLPVVTRLD
jgi:hypothetical protein